MGTLPLQIWAWVADGIALFHGALLMVYIVGTASAFSGGFLRHPLLPWQRVYLLLILLLSLSVLLTEGCVLTQMEKLFRGAATPELCYQSSFLEHYFPFIPSWMDRVGSVLLLVGGCVAVLTAMWSWCFATKKNPQASTSSNSRSAVC